MGNPTNASVYVPVSLLIWNSPTGTGFAPKVCLQHYLVLGQNPTPHACSSPLILDILLSLPLPFILSCLSLCLDHRVFYLNCAISQLGLGLHTCLFPSCQGPSYLPTLQTALTPNSLPGSPFLILSPVSDQAQLQENQLSPSQTRLPVLCVPREIDLSCKWFIALVVICVCLYIYMYIWLFDYYQIS